MDLNLIGLVSALATFSGVWLGHVGVRKIEAISVRLWPPILGAIMLGVGFIGVAAWSENTLHSPVCGILGITFLWDALEFYRQQKRVKRGHAPANPKNSRHARILAKYPKATTFDWLNRNPHGEAYTADELEVMMGIGE